ncbi:YiiD C-terminal domain-containing protein [Nitratifractor sp.]|uniref:PaaI family thioesterase n=1 Tax=Nitratifractor sp. TaxID=2268144 RepID=UPI0025E01505|nr:YiiD C-terminal domain-containing protein [Nitratifractor sp.]
MKATDIPFVRHIGIEEENSELSLDFKNDVLNHIKTIHASAQFTLAETQSGIHLQNLFPDLEGKVLPVLRDAQIKYRKPAQEKIIAFASTDAEDVAKFRSQFEKRGRASIQINVDVKDVNGVLTSQAAFTWFVQAL